MTAQETRTIPIIFVQNFDPVGSGLVKSLVTPESNVTGFTSYEPAMGSKWLELLKGVAPQVARVAIIYNPETAPYAGTLLRSIEAAGPNFAGQPIAMPNQDAETIEKAIEAFAREINPSLMVLPDVTTTVHEKLNRKISDLTSLARNLPMAPFRYRWWSNELRGQSSCSMATSGFLCRSGVEGREAGQPTDPTAHKVRACHQSHDRSGGWPDHPCINSFARR